MASTKSKLDQLIEDTRELEGFLHALIPTLDKQKLRQGDDVLNYAKKLKLKIPESLRGEEVIWDAEHSDAALERRADSLVLVRPGHIGVVGLVIGCVRIRKWRICLECGWLWCRIVIIRRF